MRRSHGFFRSCPVFLVLGMFTLALLIFPQQAKKPQRIMNTDPELRLKWYDQHVEMKNSSKFKDLKWQFLGPTNVSGRITDIAVVAPKGKNYTMYVATASGGVWKTENEGVTWSPIFEQGPSTAIGDIAIAPSNQQMVWVGTGARPIFSAARSPAPVFTSPWTAENPGSIWGSRARTRSPGLSSTLKIRMSSMSRPPAMSGR